MGELTKTLGKRLTAQEVAEYLVVDAETVRRYYSSLGGIRLGRLILFFENLIIQAIKENSHALQEEEKEQGGVDSRCDAPREEVREEVMAAWIKKYPGTRCWAWWEIDAPRWERKFDAYFDGKKPEPRKRIGGPGRRPMKF